MKSLLLVLAFFVVAVVGGNPNIPLDVDLGRPVFVEPEELLEAALYPPLLQLGATDIDVDDVPYKEATFTLEIVSDDDLDQDLKLTLSKILRLDLGLKYVTVKDSPKFFDWRSFLGVKRSLFYLIFNPETFVEELRPLANKVYATSPLSLEDSSWD